MIVEPNKTLTSYQAEFVEQFLSSSDTRQLLAGPTGSGLAICAQEIISRVLKEDPSFRVLIVTGRMLVLQWMRRLEDIDGPLWMVEGTRRNLRELIDRLGTSDVTWPEGSVVVMDSWSIERFSDLQDSVMRSSWDLVVWDGLRTVFSALRQKADRLAMLQRMGGRGSVRRLLVLAHSRDLRECDLDLPVDKRTEWDRSLIVRSDSLVQKATVQETTIRYDRTDAELQFRAQLEAFVARWADREERMSPLHRLLAAADSSPLALQEWLQRLRPSKSAIVLQHQHDELDEPQFVDPTKRPAIDEPTRPDMREEIAAIQDALDGLSVDSKLEALLAYIGDPARGNLRTVIECRFSATARYVTSALEELKEAVFSVTAELPAKEILRRLGEFEARGGILIATVAALQGVEFAADLTVAYDYFGPRASGAFRPRIRPIADEKVLQVINLVDTPAMVTQREIDEES